MCLYKDNKHHPFNRPLIAKEDIICYKKLAEIEDTYITPCTYTHDNNKLYIDDSISLMQRATVIFKSVEAAQQAIEILGEETVKLALMPLY